MVWLWILIAVLVLLAVIFVYYYNKIVVLGNNIDNAFSQIDVQLKKRNDLIPNLVNTVKGYAKHEKETFELVTKARTALMNAKNFDAKMKASNMLTDALKSVFAVAESYPELKANTNFLQLQQELSDIESKIAYTRQYFNDSVLMYNNTVIAFPGMIFAKIYGKDKKEYFAASASERSTPKVEF